MRPDSHEILRPAAGAATSASALVLGAFVLLLFAVTLVKLYEGADLRGYDHTHESLPEQGGG